MKPVRKTQGKQKLAIFDIDGTIFRSSLLIELTNALIAKKIFPKSAAKEIEKDYKSWLNREGEYARYISKVVMVYEKCIIGCSEEDVSRVVRTVLKKENKKLYRYTRQLIKELKKQKYFLFAISGSPGHILTSFAKDIGFDKYLGGYYEVKNGKFTGVQPYGNPAWDKRKTLERFLLTAEDKYDLKSSVGVGDTESDISFLEMVGKPIAFNPNMGLAKFAKKKGWRIVVERKDVIYDIADFKILSG